MRETVNNRPQHQTATSDRGVFVKSYNYTKSPLEGTNAKEMTARQSKTLMAFLRRIDSIYLL